MHLSQFGSNYDITPTPGNYEAANRAAFGADFGEGNWRSQGGPA
jgi:hypothetical protein